MKPLSYFALVAVALISSAQALAQPAAVV